jgi:two-component system phosphate regulon sensor histidine kinase PhoR
MPRTRLVWHLFAGWCGLVACGLVAASWLASVELARLSEEASFRRMDDVARLATGSEGASPEPSGTPDEDALGRMASLENLAKAADMRLEIFSATTVSAGETATGSPAVGTAAADGNERDDPERLGREQRLQEDAALAEIRQGAAESRSGSYDAESGRRVLTLARAIEGGRILRVTSDTAVADRSLRSAQLSLMTGFLAAAALAIGGGYAIARRSAAGVEELAEAASRLARGSLDVPIPRPDLAELATIAAAVELLRDQLLERARTIGRQGSQQEAVLASMVEGVLAVDDRHRLLSINLAAAKLLHLEPGKVLLRPLQEVVRNPDLRRFVLRAIDCKETIEDDLLLRDGMEERTILVRGTALRDPRGIDHGAVIVLNDVTHFRRLENVRRDFVANVSHELKTPTASIRGFVETLLDGAVDNPDDARRFLRIVARQADRLEAIIEDLLALSRIERIEESSDLPLEHVPLSDVVAAAVHECQLRARERSIVIDVDCDPLLATAVNPPLLEQAVINLVDNAIKYSDPGRTVRVAVTAALPSESGSSRITIAVEDQGCGIDEQFLPRIFERFYRVDRARSRKLGGTGLGLSIVKHIVQAHGGTVDVRSHPGVGSVFSIHLPVDEHSTAASGLTT